MNKYVVSFFSHFDNNLVSEIVFANDMEEAFRKGYFTKVYVDGMPKVSDLSDADLMKELKQYMFDCDAAVDIIRID